MGKKRSKKRVGYPPIGGVRNSGYESVFGFPNSIWIFRFNWFMGYAKFKISIPIWWTGLIYYKKGTCEFPYQMVTHESASNFLNGGSNMVRQYCVLLDLIEGFFGILDFSKWILLMLCHQSRSSEKCISNCAI